MSADAEVERAKMAESAERYDDMAKVRERDKKIVYEPTFCFVGRERCSTVDIPVFNGQ